MKRFIRTLAGKTVLFTVCILSACLLVACVFGAFAMLQEDSYFYTHTEQEILENMGSDSNAPLIRLLYSLRYSIYGIALLALLLTVLNFTALMYAAGRRPDTEELKVTGLGRVPFDLLLAAVIGMTVVVEEKFRHYNVDTLAEALPVFGVILLGLVVFLGLCTAVSARIKRRELFKNTLIFRLLKGIGLGFKAVFGFIGKILGGLPLVWKTLLGLVLLSLAELVVLLICVSGYRGGRQLTAWWLLEKVILIPALLVFALQLKTLQKSGEAIAAGNLNYVTNTKGMLWDVKAHGNDLNSIAAGMNLAVEERLKSERMKTELITNVSHDIKTPLTSIISYAGLISAEPCENPKITEYAEVLTRQSERLKRLIEDLVEASKASTGNLEVSLAPCDAGIFLSQVAGEYEEKLAAAGLQLMTRQPEGELRILADGRRMWRIFDNLMNNVCKYALAGTRVYLSLEKAGGQAVFSFKNTSREPLDMTEEELMERFTRGDASRNTEGNGLGLAIAKSMAELQGGSLRLVIDGDLFKAVLSFPLLEEK